MAPNSRHRQAPGAGKAPRATERTPISGPEQDFPAPVAHYVALTFPDPPPDRPHVILNMIASADGKAAIDGGESALSSPTDKLVLQALRVHADAILNGAGTARQTGATPTIRDPALRQIRARRGRPAAPLQVILTRTAQFDPDARFLRRNVFPLVLFVSPDAQPAAIEALKRSGRPIEMLSGGRDYLRDMLARLHSDWGVHLLLVEGGPTLNASLFHAGLIDEFFLTLAPHIVAGNATITPVEGLPFAAQSMPGLELVSALPNSDTNEVYLHWRLRYSKS